MLSLNWFYKYYITLLKKILFLAHHRFDRSPGQRYRFEQFFDFLENNGIQCNLANIINENDEKYLYHSKNILKKLKIGIKSFFQDGNI